VRCKHIKNKDLDRNVSCGASCGMAYASVEDRIKVQQNIYKPRNPSNMRRQFYAGGNDLSSSSDDDLA